MSFVTSKRFKTVLRVVYAICRGFFENRSKLFAIGQLVSCDFCYCRRSNFYSCEPLSDVWLMVTEPQAPTAGHWNISKCMGNNRIAYKILTFSSTELFQEIKCWLDLSWRVGLSFNAIPCVVCSLGEISFPSIHN